MLYRANSDLAFLTLIFHIYHDGCLFRLESIFALMKGSNFLFNTVLWGIFACKIINKGFTRYGNDCILIESVHRLPRENTNLVGKPRNSSICFFTHIQWSMIIQNQ